MIQVTIWQAVGIFVAGGFCALVATGVGARRAERKMNLAMGFLQAMTSEGGAKPPADVNERLRALRERRGRADG